MRPLIHFDLAPESDWDGTLRAITAAPVGTVALGVAESTLPQEADEVLAALTVTIAPSAPGRAWVADHGNDVDLIEAAVRSNPGAASTLATVLRLSAEQDVESGLNTESLAYSMLLAGPEFAAWRTRTATGPPVNQTDDAVLLERDGDRVTVILNRPDRHNAFGHRVRDMLLEALDIPRHDASVREVVLRGAGPSFCSGGDLSEFGTTPDVVVAHHIRTSHSAGLAVHGVRDRTRAIVHGACIGAGVELAAFAGYVEAHHDTFFSLPELGMGLIPGAGGTVSLPRRIGRWRTAYLALTGRRITAATALDWGLVDAVD